MINGISELEELEKENQELKEKLSKQFGEYLELETTCNDLKSKIRDLQEEIDLLYGDDFETVKYNFEGLIEYLDDNHILTDEIKNIIEYYLKFYV